MLAAPSSGVPVASPLAATAISWMLVGGIGFVAAAAVIKIRQLRRWRAAQLAFAAAVAQAGGETEVADAVRRHPDAPSARLCDRLLSLPHPDRTRAVLEHAALGQRRRVMTLMVSLGTVAAVAPFVGLLGTVYGILDAFMRIGEHGSATLAVVAPAIGDALSATALGLVAAIPAVVIYNMLGRALDDMLQDMRAVVIVAGTRLLGLKYVE